MTPFVTNYLHNCSGNEIYNTSGVCFTPPLLQPAHMLGIAMPQTVPHWPFPPTQYQQPFPPIHHSSCRGAFTFPSIAASGAPARTKARSAHVDSHPGAPKCRSEEIVHRASIRPPPPFQVRCGLWNTRGFVNNDHSRLRHRVILTTKLDLICLCESFLRDTKITDIVGHKWFGSNLTHISERANRRSGGVGILVK